MRAKSIYETLSYVLTIVALIFAVQRVQQPAALTKIFERGEA